MSMISQQIQYLSNATINKAKWDACIEQAPNGLIYGYSFYLDHMAVHWDGLVLNDYEAVMPLPWKSKFGIQYVYQPYFTAQGGIFSRVPVSDALAQQFISAIPVYFRYVNIHSNEGIPFPPSNKYTTQLRSNYVLPLAPAYEQLYNKYTDDAKKNLRRAEKFQLSVRASVDAGMVIALFRQYYGLLNKKISDNEYERLDKLFTYLLSQKMALVYEVREGLALVAGGVFLKDAKRFYYILGAPTKRGRQCKAIHWLVDYIIKIHAGSPYSFDFEGSEIASVADFYQKFSPEKKTYQQVIYNRLPFLLRFLKK
jgi:hypothetical protein